MMGRMLDEGARRAAYDCLDTVGEALGRLRLTESVELRKVVADSRHQVEQSLETALSCSLDARISASELSNEDWLRTMYLLVGEAADPFQPKNRFDREFMQLLEQVWTHSEAELLEVMKNTLKK